MKKNLFITLALIAISIGALYYFYPKEKQTSMEKIAIQKCIELCLKEKEKRDLSNGPCLSDNNTEWNISGWVCDVAHWPRKPVDDKIENQCNEWWEAHLAGKEIHFVEVDPNCRFIRVG